MLTCNNKDQKFKNLTVGKQYEGTIDGDFAEIVNDAGVKARYNKKYFALTETPSTPEPPVRRRREATPPQNISTSDFVNRFVEVDFEEDSLNGTLSVLNLGSEFYDFSIESTNSSCGVGFFSGVLSIIDMIEDHVESDFRHGNRRYHIVNMEREEIFTLILEKIIRYREDFSYAFLVLSSNNPESTFIQELVAKDYVTSTEVERNPNSGNDIAVWVLNCNEIRQRTE